MNFNDPEGHIMQAPCPLGQYREASGYCVPVWVAVWDYSTHFFSNVSYDTWQSGQAEEGSAGRSPGDETNYALSVASETASFVANRPYWSDTCQKTLADIGISVADLPSGLTADPISRLQLAAGSVVFLDGTTSRAPLGDLYTNSAVPGLAALVPLQTVADVFAGSPGTRAMTELGGNRIWIRPSYFNQIGSGWAAAVVMHELVHNIIGLTDDDLARNLGITLVNGSRDITVRLLTDCLN